MNKKLIFFGMILLAAYSLSADSRFKRTENGWYSYDTQMKRWKEVSPSKNISDSHYWERNYPNTEKSDLSTFKTGDRTYRVDQTNRDMGNNR